MSDHILISLAEVVVEAEAVTACQDCGGGLGIHVDLDDPESWAVVAVHNPPCAAVPARRLRLVDPPADEPGGPA